MKINKSVEQAIYVLLILALQKDGEPLKSRVLSAHLKVSDSYLKKILMKLEKRRLDRRFRQQKRWLPAGPANWRYQH
ncbi:Rrf2 family transcriptional regulator [Lactobacillus delbrueckii subsp. bulgaricus]|uniref:Rrf2 family transcriptional regulator n=1 Tax=Lactobacillus delbrueckii TaxID=1584 RepID=UPI001E4791F2|nr:Rrf2 family transcriptional regulator [Lactobacillus delbrueckii]MCD5481575.1 Rrf2 family transcriptional regulator [Lactobacillus delbrueckii subsp. bulgaricus]